jgi:hypothetical protein
LFLIQTDGYGVLFYKNGEKAFGNFENGIQKESGAKSRAKSAASDQSPIQKGMLNY